MKELIKKSKDKPRAVLAGKIFLVVFLILVAFTVRVETFWLPKLIGDQAQYLGLAMKLEEYGFREGYNLRGIRGDVFNVPIKDGSPEETGQIFIFTPTPDPDWRGDILESLESLGAGYYDQPFFHKPPAFSYVLMFSHRLFLRDKMPYSIVKTNLAERAIRLRPEAFFKIQFYAAIVPLLFGLGTVLLTFFLGVYLFNFRVGLYSALLYALHPVTILMDQRVLSDGMVSFFVVLAVLLFVIAQDKDSLWLYLLSGASCGISVLAKQTGGYFLIAVLIFTVLSSRYQITQFSKLHRIIFNKAFLFTSVGVFLVSGFWFFEIYRRFGNPLWRPHLEAAPEEYASLWFYFLRSRPNNFILYTIGIPFLGPPMAAAYFSLKRFLEEFENMFNKKDHDPRFVLFWILILVFGVMPGAGEHRRMMPVYPMIAIMAIYCFEKIRTYSGRISAYMGNCYVRETVFILFFIASSFWMVHVGRMFALQNEVAITIPF